jgi:hypothetical protein
VDSFDQLMKRSPNEPEAIDIAKVPQGLNLKLAILGRASSGKKTIATQLVEKFGSDLKVFCMDKMIRECIEYANPKEKEDVVIVDPKAKAPKKVTETVAVDPFEGKNAEEYKKIGKELKSKYFSSGDLPACDLVE